MTSQPPRPEPRARLTTTPRARRALLRWMIGGSVALHLLLLALLLWNHQDRSAHEAEPSEQVAMVFENDTGAKTPSLESAQPSPVPSAATGTPDAPILRSTPDTRLASLPPPPAPHPEPMPPPLAASQPVAPTAVAPPPAPQPPAPAPPQPEQPSAQTPKPPVKHPPPTVTLNEGEAPALTIPPYVPPAPPPPLPPLPPRTASPQRQAARTVPRTASPLSNPQDFSFNSAPQRSPGRASRGLDFSVAPRGSQTSQVFGYVAGAKPAGDWVGALKRWVQERSYYPEQAIADREQGATTVQVTIDRNGQVLDLRLVRSARSAFLDGAWQDVWRRARVPPFTPDMQGDTTTIVFTMHYILHGG